MSSCVSMLMKNQELERRLHEVERKAGATVASFPCVAIPELRSLELERRLEEMERRAGATSSTFPYVAITELKSLELERRLEEMERKAGATATSFPCVAISELKSLELERRIEEMERKMGFRGTSFPCVSMQFKNLELERSLEEMTLLKVALHRHEERLAEIDWKGSSRGVSSAPAEVLLKIQLDSRALEQKVAELEKGSSVAESSASGEMWRQKKEELDQKVSEFRWKFAGSLETERLERLITESQELDLAFLVDATASMEDTFEAIKKNAKDIAAAIKKKWPQLKLYLAFAPYRDYGDQKKDDGETIHFTDNHDDFVKKLDKIQAGGGSIHTDTAEDVFSGLERVAKLRNWKSRTRVLVHIADAPCHGQKYHNFDHVEYSGLDYLWDTPYKTSITLKDKRVIQLGETGAGLSIRELLRVLREDRQVIRYLFCHLDKSKTDKMIRVFKKKCGTDGSWIQEEDLTGRDLNQLLNVVVEMCATSIALSMEVGVVNNSDSWEAIPCKEATQLQYKLPDSLDDLFEVVATNGKLERNELPDLMVQIRKNFSQVEIRSWPYRAVVYKPGSARREMMVKTEFKAPDGPYDYETYANEAYFEQLEVHSVAAKLAEEFNKVFLSDNDNFNSKTVQFIPVWTLKVGSKLYNMEQSLHPNPTRNVLVSEIETPYANVFHAFSHWTYHRSNGVLLIDGFQLAYFQLGPGSKEIWLCTPALHCKDPLRYQTTARNWGVPGMKHFLETHQCNAICESLHLPSSKISARYL